MIIRDEYSYLIRRETPRPTYYPVMLPISSYGNGLYTGAEATVRKLTFHPEVDERVHYPDVYVNEEDIPYRWGCLDCYSASGDRNAFVTDWEKIKDLVWGQPSPRQMDEIREHAKQHQIIWSWVRGLEKK